MPRRARQGFQEGNQIVGDDDRDRRSRLRGVQIDAVAGDLRRLEERCVSDAKTRVAEDEQKREFLVVLSFAEYLVDFLI
jgi:hypothetical protein